MIQRNEQSRAELSDTGRAKTLQEKLRVETLRENSQWRRWVDDRCQTVPYAQEEMSDRQWWSSHWHSTVCVSLVDEML